MGYFPFFIQEVVIINITRVSRWPHSTQNMKSAFVPPFKHTLPYTTESSQHSRFLPIPDGNQTISWIWNSSGKVWAINFISPSGCWLIITVSADYYFPNCSSETRGSFHDNWNFQKKDWIKVIFVALRLTRYFSSANTEFWPDLKTEPRHSPGHKSQIIWAIMEI